MQNLQLRLIDLLQSSENFIVNDQLNKNKIIETILQFHFHFREFLFLNVFKSPSNKRIRLKDIDNWLVIFT